MFAAGEFGQALTHGQQGIDVYNPQQHHDLTLLYGQNLGFGCFGFAALSQWVLGYPHQARRRCHEGLRQAQLLSHPLSLSMTLFWAVWLHQFFREAHSAQEYVETLLALAKEHNFAYMHAYGLVMQGWILDTKGPDKGGWSSDVSGA